MMRRTGILWLALLAGVAFAGPVDDYATQWPIALSGDDAGAYGVTLDASVYRQAQSPALRDVDVINAEGVAVPAQLFRPDDGMTEADRRVPVRWFVLPTTSTVASGDWSMAVERSSDGRVLRVETRDTSARRGDASAAAAWLLDTSDVDTTIEALHLEWAPGAGSVDHSYRVEASDDLRAWRVVQSVAQLVDLSREGERLVQRRVPVGTQARYLRLLPAGGTGVVQLAAVQAELAPVVKRPPLQWQLLSGEGVEEQGVRFHAFTLDGRYPVEAADVQLDGNNTGQWTLYSREDAASPWTLRAGPWVAYAIGSGNDANRSAPQPLSGPTRDREWKLVGNAATTQPPGLRLGWRPEALVFVAQAPPPYRLVAGSARTGRADAPVAQSLEEIRRVRGPGWRPGVATPGAMQPLAGERALQPAAVQRDWRSWLLWTLLVAGALLVAGFAMSLLRKPQT